MQRTNTHHFIGVPASDSVAIKLVVNSTCQWNIQRMALKPESSRARSRNHAARRRRRVSRCIVNPIGIQGASRSSEECRLPALYLVDAKPVEFVAEVSSAIARVHPEMKILEYPAKRTRSVPRLHVEMVKRNRV